VVRHLMSKPNKSLSYYQKEVDGIHFFRLHKEGVNLGSSCSGCTCFKHSMEKMGGYAFALKSRVEGQALHFPTEKLIKNPDQNNKGKSRGKGKIHLAVLNFKKGRWKREVSPRSSKKSGRDSMDKGYPTSMKRRLFLGFRQRG